MFDPSRFSELQNLVFKPPDLEQVERCLGQHIAQFCAIAEEGRPLRWDFVRWQKPQKPVEFTDAKPAKLALQTIDGALLFLLNHHSFVVGGNMSLRFRGDTGCFAVSANVGDTLSKRSYSLTFSSSIEGLSTVRTLPLLLGGLGNLESICGNMQWSHAWQVAACWHAPSMTMANGRSR